MPIRSRVSALVKSYSDDAGFCDVCLMKELGIENHSTMNEATRHLARGGIVLGFARFRGLCCLCGKNRLVIHATEPKTDSDRDTTEL